jgi:hypothetical protein
MLTGLGIIGKLIEILATKLIGRKIDLVLDDRKRVCRAFTELYYCVDRLEEISTIFLNRIDLFLNETAEKPMDGNAYLVINELHNQSNSIESISRRFLEIGSEVRWAVEIFDPVLAVTIDQLYRFKYSLLYFLSDSIKIKDNDGKKLQLLAYQEPSSKILEIDMESYYDWVRENQDVKIVL